MNKKRKLLIDINIKFNKCRFSAHRLFQSTKHVLILIFTLTDSIYMLGYYFNLINTLNMRKIIK